MKRLFFATFLAVMLCMLGASKAAAQSPVTWTAETQMTSDTEGIVILTGEIADGWHIYGTQIPDGGPSPTKLYFKSKGIAFTGNVKVSPAPKKVMDSMFGFELTYWENKVTFKRPFTVEDPGEAQVTMTIKYMGCNDSSCTAPTQETFTLKVK